MKKSTLIDIKFRNKNKKRTISIFLIIVSIIFILFLTFIKVKNFNIKGMEYFNSKEIVKYVNTKKNERLFLFFNYNLNKTFRLRSDNLEDNIEKDFSYVKEVRAKYNFPNTFDIYVKERIPIGYINYNSNSKLIVDKDGYVIGVNNKEVTNKFPLFSGIELGKYIVGEKIDTKEDDKLKVFKNVTDSLNNLKNKNFINKILEIDISDEVEIYIRFYNGVDCNIGSESELDYKITVLEKLIDKYSDENLQGTYDFTLSNNPIFIPD
jgi:cell division protein FtsQ